MSTTLPYKYADCEGIPMEKVYFIDSENVADRWTSLLKAQDGIFLVFYTGKLPNVNNSQLDGIKYAFIQCHTGDNALDFQLVSYLGYELHANKAREMVIVSNDKGYDSVVFFWSERGVQISRLPMPKGSGTQLSGTVSGGKQAEFDTLINSIGSRKYGLIHLALVHLYGDKPGEYIYQEWKKKKFPARSVSWKKEARLKRLMALIIQHHRPAKFSVPQSAPAFIIEHIGTGNAAMYHMICDEFGHKGPMIYKMFKPYFPIIESIKKQ